MLIQMHLITLFRVMNPHQRCLQAKVMTKYQNEHLHIGLKLCIVTGKSKILIKSDLLISIKILTGFS